MQKPAPPNGIYVIVLIAIMLGTGLVAQGGEWISTAVMQAIPSLILVGGFFLAAGAIDIVAGVGFFAAKRWSWTLGIVASMLTGLSIVLEINGRGQSFSIGGGLVPAIIISIIYPLINIYYLTRGSVKSYLFFAKNIDPQDNR